MSHDFIGKGNFCILFSLKKIWNDVIFAEVCIKQAPPVTPEEYDL